MRKNRHSKSLLKVNKILVSNQAADKICNKATNKTSLKEKEEQALVCNLQDSTDDSVADETSHKSKSLNINRRDKTEVNGSNKKSVRKRDVSKGDDETDSEEERWLDAIESGKLEEVDDELKRMKNPHLMTARQRAMMEKRLDVTDADYFTTIPVEPLLALPSGFKEKVVSKEMLAKKAIKSKRRREQAEEKREEEKKKTVDRLLKKQDCKVNKAKQKISKKNMLFVTYVSDEKGTSISFPCNVQLPILQHRKRIIPKRAICGVLNCKQPKKYCCSKTGVSLCSLACYKINLEKLL